MLTVLLLAAFTLITLDYRSGSFGGVRRAASTIFGPIEHAVSDVVDPIGRWFSSIGHLGSYKHDNDQLRKKVADLETQLRLTARQQQEYAQEQKLLHLAGLAQYKIVAARVIAASSDLGFGTSVTIDVGSANGIVPNETVISGSGLVGKVATVGRTSATVELADNNGFIVGARLASGKVGSIGQVTGNGAGSDMTLTLFNTTTRLSIGEQLVTFGSGGRGDPFVPEVPIGTITKVEPVNGQLGQTASVKPFVDFGSLDIVAVVVHSPASVKHDALLPASPTPAPTVTVTVTATPGTTPSSGTGSPTTSSSP